MTPEYADAVYRHALLANTVPGTIRQLGMAQTGGGPVLFADVVATARDNSVNRTLQLELSFFST